MDFQIGEVIATRELQLIDSNGTTRTVLITLGKPTPFPDSADYYAPFQILGLGSEAILCAAVWMRFRRSKRLC